MQIFVRFVIFSLDDELEGLLLWRAQSFFVLHVCLHDSNMVGHTSITQLTCSRGDSTLILAVSPVLARLGHVWETAGSEQQTAT